LNIPSSYALPFGTCEKILDLPINYSLKLKIAAMIESINNNKNDFKSINHSLNELKSLIIQMELDSSLKTEFFDNLVQIGCTNLEKGWEAIKKVWASKYNERAYNNLKKFEISIECVKMSVLCQKIIRGDYSFVLHTINPLNNNKSQIYGEIVFGFGESLVNLNEGRALSFLIDKKTGKIEIESFPNKSEAICISEGIIFRSDSNCEDLEKFAGAGLFDSFPTENSRKENLVYLNNRLINDETYRNMLIHKLKDVAIVVEECFNGVPQDIEGVIKEDVPFVVQSRTQII
jgi:alpha-glucan, water dikinase